MYVPTTIIDDLKVSIINHTAFIEGVGCSASWEALEATNYLGDEDDTQYVHVHTMDAIEDWLEHHGYFN